MAPVETPKRGRGRPRKTSPTSKPTTPQRPKSSASKSTPKKSAPYRLVMRKNKGKTLKWIEENDPGHIYWLLSIQSHGRLNEELRKYRYNSGGVPELGSEMREPVVSPFTGKEVPKPKLRVSVRRERSPSIQRYQQFEPIDCGCG